MESRACEGVRFTIARMSFGRRIELTRRVREIGQRLEFKQASQDSVEQLDAALLAAEIERLYLEWGLVAIDGFEIDGRAAEPASMIARGPENLCREIVGEVKRECGLTEQERKN